jgi:hypothetical protein
MPFARETACAVLARVHDVQGSDLAVLSYMTYMVHTLLLVCFHSRPP